MRVVRRLLGRENLDEPRAEQVHPVGLRDVPVQRGGVELREDENPTNVRVQAVADRDVDQPVFAANRNRRLRSVLGERERACEPWPPPRIIARTSVFTAIYRANHIPHGSGRRQVNGLLTLPSQRAGTVALLQSSAYGGFRLIPREERFYDDFQAAGDELKRGALRCSKTMLAPEHGRFGTKLTTIKEVEHKCDFLTHEIIQRLNRTFVTPLDREDIHALARSLDDVMDAIDAVGDASSGSTASTRCGSARASWRAIITRVDPAGATGARGAASSTRASSATPSRSTGSRTRRTASISRRSAGCSTKSAIRSSS